jgi:hypothetical protein
MAYGMTLRYDAAEFQFDQITPRRKRITAAAIITATTPRTM